MDSLGFHHLDNNEAHLPPGFRFHPTDEELITYYLIKKVLDSSFTCRAIAEVDLNKCEPWQLPDKAKMGEKEWYFFSLRDRKYPTGLRTNRATEAGYWKATGKDREIFSLRTCSLVGMKKTLVFYRGRAPKGEKSNWVMHEYRLEGKLSYHYLSRSSKDEWVISRVFQKVGGASGGGSCGSKKSRLTSGGVGSFCSDVGSPSSTSLPPLLDTSTTNTTIMNTTHDENYSYNDSKASSREHVPCFSTANATTNNFMNQFSFGAHQTSLMNTTNDEVGVDVSPMQMQFPSLRSLQDNLQLPSFFFSAGDPPMPSDPHYHNHQNNWVTNTTGMDHQRVGFDQRNNSRMALGPTELDCMWTY